MTAVYRAIAPSNIAFLKYWGKRDAAAQWPANDSLSMTLNKLATVTEARVIEAADHTITYAGTPLPREHTGFNKAYKHLDRLARLYSFQDKLAISTTNAFPTGAGIASSASGLAALTVAAMAAWTKSASLAELAGHDLALGQLAHLARLGSGSAGRSLFGGYVQWQAGASPEAQVITPLFAADHWALADTICLFSEEEKSKSSTEAHGDAWSSPLFRVRVAGSPERMQGMVRALERRSLAELGPLLETEALDMHAVMMTAVPAQHYLNEKALAFLADFREARRRGLFEAYFTIDAGPNIHIIHEHSSALRRWLDERFAPKQLLHDSVGEGPTLIRGEL